VKVVAARRSLVAAERPFAPVAILRNLSEAYPDCSRFALERGGAVFLGATPELLALRSGRTIRTEALAGTRARTQAGDDDFARDSLLGDDKERREHAHVISAIVEALTRLCAEAPHVDKTSVRSLRNVHHLCTPICGTLRADTHVLDLVTALHPTPAVCGLPQKEAARFIAAHEPVSRGMYAAPVGWFDGRGDGCFRVAIRSALLRENRAWLYAGAGIVAGSDPQKEYRETAVKQRVMLSALSDRA
jgi:isochorismate synthase